MKIEIAKRKYPDGTQDHQPDTVEVWQMSEWPIVDQIKVRECAATTTTTTG